MTATMELPRTTNDFVIDSEMMPRDMSGDFLSRHTFEPNPVVEVCHDRAEDIHRALGRLEINRVRLQNGDRITAFSTVPKNPITDLSVASSTAWFTGIRYGFNRTTVDQFLDEGIPMNFMSIERNPRLHRGLVQSAANLLETHRGLIEHYNDGLSQPLLDPEHIALSGVSQGAMKTLVATALTQHAYFDFEVEHADAIGPCCAQPTSLLPGGGSLQAISAQARQELASVRHLAKFPGEMLALDPRTLDTTAAGIVCNIINQKELRSGVTGEAVQALSPTQRGHIVSMKGDRWLGQGELFAGMLDGHEYFTTESVDVGGHLGVLIGEQRERSLGRMLDAVERHYERSIQSRIAS